MNTGEHKWENHISKHVINLIGIESITLYIVVVVVVLII